MEVLKPSAPPVNNDWNPQQGADGVLRCSCGRTLRKVDEDTYECSYGFPRYRLSQGEVTIDKFGNLLFKFKEHGNKKKD